jgi:hypothetical protein
MPGAVKLSADELAGATEIAPVKLSAEEIAGAQPIDEPVPPPAQPSFVDEARSRIAAPFKAIGSVFSNATLPTSPADAIARIKQNAPAVGEAVAAPFVKAVDAARGVGTIVTHPTSPAAGREAWRGIAGNIPFGGLALDRLGVLP